MTEVRPPILAGSWYPAEPGRLRALVEGFLAGADPRSQPRGKPRVAVVPHAGLEYSGSTAGKLYGLLRDVRYDAVFVLAPSHRTRLTRPALSGMAGFATPLGDVPVAVDIVRELARTEAFAIDDRAHAFEHAVEIQLPFLQCALPDLPGIVPVLVPHLDAERRRAAARVLDRWRDDRHLFLVSTDFTHYGGAYGFVPFTDRIPERLEELDTGAILKILAHDAEGLLGYGASSGITMCGLDAAALALSGEAPDGYEAALVDYARSADRERDFTMSVSYAAVLVSDGREAATATATAPADAAIGAADRHFLLELARRAVAAAAAGLPSPAPAAVAGELGTAIGPALREPRGTFVTLTDAGQLRGCIGTIEPVRPLVDAVVDNAAAAALDDPRFTPVREDEVPRLDLEISVLTPLRPVAGPREIEIGRHGILLSRGRHRAVFLPQVAREQGWDLDTTLDHLAVKAGLPADAWRSGTEFLVFEAELIAEEPS